jgi:proline iminopeptidase
VLASVTVPTLVCVGRHDHLLPGAASEYPRQALPDARLVVLEHSSHTPFWDEPDRFIQALP